MTIFSFLDIITLREMLTLSKMTYAVLKDYFENSLLSLSFSVFRFDRFEQGLKNKFGRLEKLKIHMLQD